MENNVAEACTDNSACAFFNKEALDGWNNPPDAIEPAEDQGEPEDGDDSWNVVDELEGRQAFEQAKMMREEVRAIASINGDTFGTPADKIESELEKSDRLEVDDL